MRVGMAPQGVPPVPHPPNNDTAAAPASNSAARP
jgi:hypothetical protein